jgi:two-component system, OmpR family, response regulator
MRVLLVEDEMKLAALLERGLVEEGYAVDVAAKASDGSWLVDENSYDVIILDVMLPDGNGFDLCRALRDRGCWSPVLMLTARDGVDDRVNGLDSGADDYLTKPFAFDELLARLRALLRRVVADRPTVLQVDGLSADPASREVARDGTPIALTAKEYALLEYFMRYPGRVHSRSDLVEHVWDFAFETDSNVVDVYVRYLRQKIDRPFGTDSIETVRGVGYRLRRESADVPTDQS